MDMFISTYGSRGGRFLTGSPRRLLLLCCLRFTIHSLVATWETVERVPRTLRQNENRVAVSRKNNVASAYFTWRGKRAHQHQQRRTREMKVRHQRIDNSEIVR